MDRVSLQALQCYGYHGVFPEENKLGQRFIIDLDLDLDLARAGRNDDLFATVNYAEIAERVKQIIEGPPFKLVEAVAEAVAAMLLREYPLIQEVHVRLTKPNPPVPFHFAGVTITIHRKRE
jgi:dihydroneopterin aldolase